MISLAETTQVLGTRIWCLCRLLSQDPNNCQSSVKVSTGHVLLITSQCRKPLGALRVYLRSANLKKSTTCKQNGRVPQLFMKEWDTRLCTYWICWNHVVKVTCQFADFDHCTMLEVKVSCWLIYIMVAEQNTSWGWVNLHYHWEWDSTSNSSVQLVIIMVIAKSDPNINDRAKHIQLFSIYCKENWLFTEERYNISCCFFPISSKCAPDVLEVLRDWGGYLRL